MKYSNTVCGIIALVFICLVMILATFKFTYDVALNQVESNISNTMDKILSAFICLLSIISGICTIRHFYGKKAVLKSKDSTPFRTPADSQSLDGLRYKIAMEQLNCTIFDFSINDNVIKLKSNTMLNTNLNTDISLLDEYNPELFIEKGIIHSDSAEEYLRVFREIREGKPSASCTVQIRNVASRFCWCKMMLTTIFDKNHKADCAFGIIEDITEQKETEKRFVKEHQYREAILSSALSIFKVNLTKNRITKGYDNWIELFGIPPTCDYSKMISLVADRGVYSEDREQFIRTYSLDSVLSAFRKGKKEITLEYRRKLLTDEIKWVQCTIHLLRDQFTQDIKGIAYIKDINNQKIKEMEMQFRAERDSLSGLYNRGAIRCMVTDFLNSEEGKNNQHALLIVDIDNFKAINDNHGHIQGDTVLKKVAGCMQLIFRSTDIIGRLGGDEFILFLKNISQPEAAARKAKELNEALKGLYIEDSPSCTLSASIGIAQCPSNGTTFDELYRNADIALYQAKKSGKNNYVLFSLCTIQNTFAKKS